MLLKPGYAQGCARSFRRLLSSSFAKCQQTPRGVPVEELETRPLVPETNTKTTNTVPRNLRYTNLSKYELERRRVIPLLSTYYGGNPYHDQVMSSLSRLLQRHHRLPRRVLDERESKETQWISFEEYKEKAQLGRIKVRHYEELVLKLNELRGIQTELMPHDVIATLKEFTRSTSDEKVAAQRFVKTLDEFGRANTVGKRKDAVANISMVRGEGLILVNGKAMTEYFTRDIDRGKLVYPFQVVAQESKYNIFITCHGGGVSGQAEASMYGIAKALVVFNPMLKPRLRKAGLMTRDSRVVERKKPGKVKARKSPTWVKR